MRSYFTKGLMIVGLWALFAASLHAQLDEYEWMATDPGADWNVEANWESGNTGLNFVPDTDQFAGEAALIDNGGTANVTSAVPRISQLSVPDGTVAIQTGGVVETVVSGGGSGGASTSGSGTIHISGNGMLVTETNLTSAGTLRLTGPDASAQVGGDFSTTGTFVAELTGNDHGLVNVDGMASLGGTLQVEASGITPSFGQSWDLLTASGISGAFNTVAPPAAAPLQRGLQYQVVQEGGTLSLSLGNALILTVDRQTGAGLIENAVGQPIEITSYAIRSERGLLSADDWTSFTDSSAGGPGWREANPDANHLAELNVSNSLSLDVGQSLDLGNPYSGGASLPSEEDVVFQYTTPDGRLETGFVEYTGAVNDFTLFVDPESGSAAIGNLSRFIETPVITSYAIRSESGALNVDNWNSFTDSGEAGEGWRTANPDSMHIAELNLTSTAEFPTGTLISLGEIFAPGAEEDLLFEYTTAGGELLSGLVQYGQIPQVMPPDGIAGDFNDNGQVEQADLNLVLLNWGNSFDTLPATWTHERPTEGIIDQAELNRVLLNWGNTAALGAAGTVPEPATCCLLGLALAAFAATRRGRRSRR